MAHAQWDTSGALQHAVIHWDRSDSAHLGLLGDVLLGVIEISEKKMTVEVNSEERAKEIKKIVVEGLGGAVRHVTTVVRPCSPRDDKAWWSGEDDEGDSLMDDPEVREMVEKHFIAHWESWVDSALPVLDGESPREAIKTPSGREKVQALLESAATNPGSGLELQAKGLERARKMLGL
jgi:hypothetical protein